MLDGWYCRSLANQEEEEVTVKVENDSDESVKPKVRGGPGAARPPPAAGNGSGARASSSSAASAAIPNSNPMDYKERYKNLKRKLKFLIYENEYFQDLLHTNQRRLLKVSKDRTFLLDRLLLYEKPAKDSSDSDATDSSDSEPEPATSTAGGLPVGASSVQTKEVMRRKHKDKEGPPPIQATTVGATRGRRRKMLTGHLGQGGHSVHQPPVKRQLMATVSPSTSSSALQQQQAAVKDVSVALSTAEITRQLQERRPTPIELMSPECTSATVPTTMLSDESPSKCYPHDGLHHLMDDDEVAAEECVPMEYTNN